MKGATGNEGTTSYDLSVSAGLKEEAWDSAAADLNARARPPPPDRPSFPHAPSRACSRALARQALALALQVGELVNRRLQQHAEAK